MLLNKNGTLVGMPEGAFMRFMGAKKARYTCPIASTRNSFLRGAVPGSFGVACEEAIASSIAKRLRAPGRSEFVLWKRLRARQILLEAEFWRLDRLGLRLRNYIFEVHLFLGAELSIRRRLHNQEQPRAAFQVHVLLGGKQNGAMRSLGRRGVHLHVRPPEGAHAVWREQAIGIQFALCRRSRK